MDSVTQVLLGATVGVAVGGKRYGAKALLWGGAMGCLPDLDVFIPMGDPVQSFTSHRGFSHSLFVLTLAAPLFAWLIIKLHRLDLGHWRHWCLLVWLSLVTHPLLDCLTIYGTQVFWPLPLQPVIIGSMFIIDPLYTLPLLVSVMAFFILRNRPSRFRINAVALSISTAYLAASLLIQLFVENRVAEDLQNRGLQPDRYTATPTPFNLLIWRILVIDGDRFHEGYVSILSDRGIVGWRQYPRNRKLLKDIRQSPAVERLLWFTHDYQVASEKNDRISITDIRMGYWPKFVFSFVVGKRVGNSVVATLPLRHPAARMNLEDLKQLFTLLI